MSTDIAQPAASVAVASAASAPPAFEWDMLSCRMRFDHFKQIVVAAFNLP
jgi:hypothetical protein